MPSGNIIGVMCIVSSHVISIKNHNDILSCHPRSEDVYLLEGEERGIIECKSQQGAPGALLISVNDDFSKTQALSEWEGLRAGALVMMFST